MEENLSVTNFDRTPFLDENEKLKKEKLFLSIRLNCLIKERDILRKKFEFFKDMANIDLDRLTLCVDLNRNLEGKAELDKLYALIHAIMDEGEINSLEAKEQAFGDHFPEKEEVLVPEINLGIPKSQLNLPDETSACTPLHKCGRCLHCKSTLNGHHIDQACLTKASNKLQNPSDFHYQPANLRNDFGDDNVGDDDADNSNPLICLSSDDSNEEIRDENESVSSLQQSLINSPSQEFKLEEVEEEDFNTFVVMPNLEEENSLDSDKNVIEDRSSENHSLFQNGMQQISDQPNTRGSLLFSITNKMPNKSYVNRTISKRNRKKLVKSPIKAGPPTPKEVNARIERIIKENVDVLSTQLSSWEVTNQSFADQDLQCYLAPRFRYKQFYNDDEMLEESVSPPEFVNTNNITESKLQPIAPKKSRPDQVVEILNYNFLPEKNGVRKVISERGKENILYQGYAYRLDRVLTSGIQSWRCVTAVCKGRVYVTDDAGTQCTLAREHDHGPIVK